MKANLDILEEDLNKSLDRLSLYRKGNKRKAQVVVLAGAAISAATTVSVGLAGLFDETVATVFQAIALVLSASLTVLVAWDAFFNHKRLWLLQSDVLDRLYELKSDVRHLKAGGDAPQAEIDETYARYKTAFREFNNQWKELRADQNAEEDGGGARPEDSNE